MTANTQPLCSALADRYKIESDGFATRPEGRGLTDRHKIEFDG